MAVIKLFFSAGLIAMREGHLMRLHTGIAGVSAGHLTSFIKGLLDPALHEISIPSAYTLLAISVAPSLLIPQYKR